MMETNENQVSNNIKSCRIRYGYTQEELASKLEITRETLNKIENSPFSFSINKLDLLSKAIGCNINEFFLPVKLTNSEKN